MYSAEKVSVQLNIFVFTIPIELKLLKFSPIISCGQPNFVITKGFCKLEVGKKKLVKKHRLSCISIKTILSYMKFNGKNSSKKEPTL